MDATGHSPIASGLPETPAARDRLAHAEEELPRRNAHELGGLQCRRGRHTKVIDVVNEVLEDKKLVGTSASLLVTSALLVVTRSY